MNVHTLSPSVPFLESFAKALCAGKIITGFPNPQDPFSLARATIYLPHRRACRNLRDIFLAMTDKPMLLPRIRPLGEEDVEDDTIERPEAIEASQRQLGLARLILHWSQTVEKTTLELSENDPLLIAASPYDALVLAEKLTQLLDQAETEEVPWENLKKIDLDEKHDKYWQITLIFLKIITQFWPQELLEKGLISAAQKRKLALNSAIEVFKTSQNPVIIAGSTGSIMATRNLLKAVAHLPSGAVVLPALDTLLDEISFENLTHTHPQFGLKRLITHIGVSRKTGGAEELAPALNLARENLLRELMRPVETTHQWAALNRDFVPDALEGLTLIEAANDASEALAIACLVREKLENPEETIAIITPDRAKAQLITAELQRFALEVDDSGGMPLLETPQGVYFNLVVMLLTQPYNPVVYASFITHPLNPTRLLIGDFATLDVEKLRGFQNDPVSFQTFSNETQSLATWLKRLSGYFNHLPNIHDALLSLAGEEAEGFLLPLRDIHPCIMQLLSSKITRTPASPHARVRILGLPESRLNTASHLILCGLNETIWPLTPQSDPWLNRTMREAMQLDPPERRIGLAAHDFYMLMGRKNVTLSRALKNGATPSLPSRFLQRLHVLIGQEAYAHLKYKGDLYLHYAHALDRQNKTPPASRPHPMPPLALRPLKLSVTEISTLVRDPYAIYVRHILKLKPLEGYNQDPTSKERGTLIHTILHKYTMYGGDIFEIGRAEFAPLAHLPDVRHFWWPRFERLAQAFLDFEKTRSPHDVYSEKWGSYHVSLQSGRHFTLNGIADKIEIFKDGTAALIDYKTGTPPSQKMMDVNFSPQLLLEALMLQEGTFAPLKAKVKELLYVKLTGRRENLEITPVNIDGIPLIKSHFLMLLNEFEKETTPYIPRRAPQFYDDSASDDHLSRYAEWSKAEGEE